jgi:transcriptional antiterminator
MSVQEDLNAAKESLAKKIREVTKDPKPTYTVDGRTVKHQEFLSSLIAQFKALNELSTKEEGAFEFVTEGI